jgi:hypothetical protein
MARSGGIFETEPDLHGHLKVAYPFIVYVAPNLADLEPIEITNRLRSSLDTPANGVVDALSRRTDYFRNRIYMISHANSSQSDECNQLRIP